MRPGPALLAVVLAVPAPALAQRADPQTAPPPPAADRAADPEVARIKRVLTTGTPLRDAVEHVPLMPTFRTSVTERIDIWKFWGEPDEVAAYVRPRGGAWHSEFQNMVTPDEVKNYGASIGNAETLQMAASSMAFALGLKYLTGAIAGALEGRAQRKAKEEVQQELAAFCAATPGACPDAPATPLSPP